MIQEELENEYFEWLFELVCHDMFADGISYRKLLVQLHNTEFTWTIPKDGNRAENGLGMRYRFSVDCGYEDDYLAEYLDEPCSVLEMMIALAVRCEENIMDDPRKGDRTQQWFWGMINNLGFSGMLDNNYDKLFVEETIQRFLNREYSRNGKGGLFTIRRCDYDLRDVEIWVQLLWYLDTIT